MQEHVEQREDGEVKRPRFHLKFAYRLKVHGVSDFQFVCLLEFCSVAACCLAPSIAGGGIPSGAAQMSAVVTSFLSFCTAGVYQSGQP